MDFVHMPETKGMGQILVVTDRFSKFTVLIPVKKTITTEEVYQLLWERVFAIFGTPETITSDRDKLFRSQKWMDLMTKIGVIQVLSTANHQRTDGQSERKIQEIQAYLRMFLENQKDWLEWLPLLQFALNDAENTSTKETPRFATFGVTRRSVWEKRSTDDATRTDKMTNLHQQISLEIKWNQEQMKKYYDKGRVEAPNLKRGDRVYLRRRTKGNSRDNIFTKKESTKLDCISLGPFEIKKKLPFDNYELWLPPKMKIHPVFHISLLKPTVNKKTTEDVEASEFEVDRIIDTRIKKGKRQYKIRWLGFDSQDDTWEPEKNLNCPDKIQEFEDSSVSPKDSVSPSLSQSIARTCQFEKEKHTWIVRRKQPEGKDEFAEHEVLVTESNIAGQQRTTDRRHLRKITSADEKSREERTNHLRIAPRRQ